LFAENGLTEEARVTARRKLKECGIVEERLTGSPARLSCRLNWMRLELMLCNNELQKEQCCKFRQKKDEVTHW